MPLAPGARLGPYEIVSAIGAGGMGEVYRARDSKLKRDVALKILPDAFAADPDRMTRFHREAEVLASLNHPNIATIYGFQDNALVMELIEGETLKGPLPIETALQLARQIAEALEYAHERGIIHRDLKPANVKVTPDGAVKVLDFGLAKAIEDPVASVNAADSPTITLAAATRAGMILGTAAYMSPEQAHGKNADRRADIWSFGAVFYEMLTGEQAFKGESVSDTLASVLKMEPDWNRLPANTPSAIRKLLRRCLTKDRRQRLQAIGEARIAIEESLTEPESGTEVPRGLKVRPPWAWTGVAGILGLGLIVAGGGWYNAMRPAPLRPLIRLNIVVDDRTPLERVNVGVGAGNMLALSPDGSRLALTLRGADGKVRLHTRLLNQSQVTPLAGTENASYPFFSPDGDWIGFSADGKLKKVAVEGGATVTLCDAPSLRGASWGDDGNIIAALSPAGVLSRIPSAGGMPVPVTKLNPSENTHRWPQVLPGSQAIVFTAATHLGGNSGGSYDDANVDVVSLKTGERKTIERGGFSPHYLASSTGTGTGHLIYLHESTLFAVPLDPGRLALTGAPAPILEDVSSNSAAGGDFASAQNGAFVYLSGKGQRALYSISSVDSTGKTELLQAPIGLYLTPRFSPDGKRLAFSLASGKSEDIWVKDLDRDTLSHLSFLGGTNRFPVWTPDGKNIVFKSTDPAAPGLYWIRSDGSGEAHRLTGGKSQESPYSISPDGKRLAFHQDGGNSGSQDIFTASIESDSGHPKLGKAELFLGTPSLEICPAFSPDGRWLAYQSNESGNFEVYVRPFPGPGGRSQISTGGGFFPLWSRNARDLVFQTPDFRVMAVSYTAKGDAFAPGKLRVWTETRLRNPGTIGVSNYDLAPNGKRLAALLADDASGEKLPTHLTFLLNFYDELRRRAPGNK
jgi:Tol biopolymer transport system component